MSATLSFLFEIAIKAAVLAGLGGLLASLALRRRPAAGHLIWVAVFLSIALLPIAAPLIGHRTTILIPESGPVAPAAPFQGLARHARVAGAAGSLAKTGAKAAAATSSDPQISLPLVLFFVWILGFAIVAARGVAGLASLRTLRRFGTRPIDLERLPVDPKVLSARIGLNSNWELRQSATPEPATAMTWGVFRPVVLLPQDADSWSPQRLEAVLLHEFAHVRRYDFASQLLAELACALYWFNPIVWLGARAMRAGAESAADDAVLRSGVKPSDYAAELLQIAAALGKQRQALSRVGVSAMTQPKIESRLKAVLSPSARHRGITSVHALIAIAGAALSLSLFGSLHFAKANQVPRTSEEERIALLRAKEMALGTLMYAADYSALSAPQTLDETVIGDMPNPLVVKAKPIDTKNGLFPYAQSTATVRGVLWPYIRSAEAFQSPTKGGEFEFNLNVAGVAISEVDTPAEIPLWVEHIPGYSRVAVSYMDGHAKLVDPNDEQLLKALGKTFLRVGNLSPLPAGYATDGPANRISQTPPPR